jgi:hypothetical protein
VGNEEVGARRPFDKLRAVSQVEPRLAPAGWAIIGRCAETGPPCPTPLAEETTTRNDAIRLGYGLGWGLYSSPYGKVFFKEGRDEGWRHYVVCFNKPKTGILIMTNSSNGEDLYSGLLENLIGDTFTPLQWEGFKPSQEVDSDRP